MAKRCPDRVCIVPTCNGGNSGSSNNNTFYLMILLLYITSLQNQNNTPNSPFQALIFNENNE